MTCSLRVTTYNFDPEEPVENYAESPWPLLAAVMEAVIGLNGEETGCLPNRRDLHAALGSRVHKGPSLDLPSLGRTPWHRAWHAMCVSVLLRRTASHTPSSA